MIKGKSKVATGNHNAIGLVDNFVNISQALQALNLRVDATVVAASSIYGGSCEAYIICAFNAGKAENMSFVAHRLVYDLQVAI